MKSFFSAALLVTGAAASAVLDKPLVAHDNDHSLFNNEAHAHHAHQKTFPGRIPTSYESAVLARRILALTPIGITATVFPDDTSDVNAHENRPLGLKGVPVGLPEYIAACEEDDAEQAGNPTLLAITIATTFKNARAGSNVSLALQWEPPNEPTKRAGWKWWGHNDDEDVHAKAYSAASLPRFSLFGYFEPIEGQDLPTSSLAQCFVKAHSDAKYWLPGNPIHQSAWSRLVVTEVYWVGGFGDRAYIGWIPIEEWRAVTKAEYEKVRLPGESKGWNSWETGYDL